MAPLKQIKMKYSITTSPLVPVVITILLIYQLYLVPLLIAGGISIYWIWSFIFIQKEKNLLKEGIQYLMDSFGNIRTPITSIHTPLKTIYNDHCPGACNYIFRMGNTGQDSSSSEY